MTDFPFPGVNVCVVGCGHWGKNLARNFDQLGSLHAICESDPDRLKSFAGLYPKAKTYGSFESALRDGDVHGIVLATPAEQHHWMAMAALQSGKDLFVEKPIALEYEDAEEIVDAADHYGRIVMVGHLLRYHPAVTKIQQFQAEGVLGEIEYIYSNRLNMGKIRREENALWSFAPHDISVVLALIGESPVQVIATGGAYLQPNIADVTISNLLFSRGVRAHIFVSWLHPYKEQRLVVLGSRQMVVFEDTRREDKLMLFDKHIELKNGTFEAAQPNGIPIAFDEGEPLRRECLHFLECVATRRQPWTSGEEGKRVLQVLQGCQRSLQMNGEPVQLNLMARRKLVAL